MSRVLYSLAWWLALPLVLARLWWRGRKEPGYRRHLAERFGFYQRLDKAQQMIWVHAVSVGETRAAQPLVEALLHAYPRHRILLTHMTATGRDTGRLLFAAHGARVVQCYLPYDTGWMAGRFLKHFRPAISILMETEVWPNMIAECRRHAVPVALVNARLSQRSLAKAQRLSGLMTEAAHGLSCIAAQTEADAQRLRQLGAANVQVTGSIKFDVTPPQQAVEKGLQIRGQVGARPVLLCASTREGEEVLILDALRGRDIGNLLIVIVPRHPQRFDDVARLIGEQGWRMQRRSALGSGGLSGDVQLLLGDSMGEMFAYYSACDLAFIGGSLLPLGGQNLIEACAVGKPVLIGPHTFNFAEISGDAIDAGAALRVKDANDMLGHAMRLMQMQEERAAMSDSALRFANQHRGATVRTMAMLKKVIGQP
ncbi:MAG TPA: lipid IV(A) 3-deoxy-D-manno-octulosonic acid transferase [Noviherbaspirillum sp.]|jgi:3-deoxy-D-manno-octulosonic-acid transferase|uniref:lipid IV(A) 3-deoxy-D-manno-octulosonic acid transferase n=1 Tax=Noviherbaspirillum sp. TaxID=1926288 RepID=UPI002DDCF7AF|nr:lipid IV(A) 3-deoxy-D-manno-octulosonic acid transferase [Noviherbaspirillum sp.]HEV2610234.1 lipid IV(A) 3-deoxy-D-manno-octulosonic acid transferase [Noviherbaspirillum sp.]